MTTANDPILRSQPSADDIDGWMMYHEDSQRDLLTFTDRRRRQWIEKHLAMPIYGDMPICFYATSRGIHVITIHALKYRPWPKSLGPWLR